MFREKFGEEQALKMIAEAGFTGVDYSICDNNEKGERCSIDLSNHLEKAKEITALLKKYNLACLQTHAPFCMVYGEQFEVDNKNFLDLVRSIEFSAKIGAKAIVIHTIPVPIEEDFYAYNYNFYKALEPYAKQAGIQIAVENLVRSKFWTPYKHSGFIRQLDSPVFCACVDVGHATIVGTNPENFIAGMDKGLIKCVHLQDTDGQKDKHWIPYQGVQNWDAIIKALAQYGYDGEINLEVIHCFDNLPLELYQSLLNYIATVGKHLIKEFKKYKENA